MTEPWIKITRPLSARERLWIKRADLAVGELRLKRARLRGELLPGHVRACEALAAEIEGLEKQVRGEMES